MMKKRSDTTVSIHATTHRNLKVLSAITGINIKEFIDEAVNKEIEKRGLHDTIKLATSVTTL